MRDTRVACPDCGGTLKVTRTYTKADGVRRQYRTCQTCGSRHIFDLVYVGPSRRKQASPLEYLTRWQVKESKARQVVKAHSAWLIREYSEHLPAIIAAYERDTEPVRDKGGFLVWCIETRYPLPLNGHANGRGNGSHHEYAPPVLSEESKLWAQVLEHLQLQMTRATFDWFAGSQLVERQATSWTIAVKNRQAHAWIDNRLRVVLARTVAELHPEVTDIVIIVAESENI